jgi:hypothetical protein
LPAGSLSQREISSENPNSIVNRAFALDAVEEGRVEAIDRLIRVLAAQDKYRAQAPYVNDHEDIRRRLIERVERAARHLSPENEAETEAPPTAPANP